MNWTSVARLVLLTVATSMLGSQALAGDRHRVDIRYDAVVDGQKLEQGAYDVEITTTDETVLILTQDDKQVARIRVDRQNLTSPAPHDEVRFRKDDSGDRHILQLTFRGSRDSFRVKSAGQVATVVNP